VFFGVHLVTLRVLLYRSHYVPRVLGVLVVAAGVGYALESLASLHAPECGGLARAVLLAPALVGELGLVAWLLVKGVSVRQQPVSAPAFRRIEGNQAVEGPQRVVGVLFFVPTAAYLSGSA
jgi:hypothetical protein